MRLQHNLKRLSPVRSPSDSPDLAAAARANSRAEPGFLRTPNVERPSKPVGRTSVPIRKPEMTSTAGESVEDNARGGAN
jgi:hypothetical protein